MKEIDVDLLKKESFNNFCDFNCYVADQGCSCHINAPCSFCIHPGNPANLLEDDTAWIYKKFKDEDITNDN